MQPTIDPGTELIVHCTDDVARGDVIVYLYLDQVVVHRLIGVRRGWLLTRGDAHVIPDAPIVDPDIIMGRVETMRRGDSYDLVPPAPVSIARVLAFWFVSLAGLAGVEGVRVALRCLRAIRVAIGRRN
ncbi:MAG TPA: S24/S26 family peptidase [Thermoanaerobaculia bacterium]|nr:S24/S26 family peptidase [Thermoanaerobaculia bacterium]